MLNIDNTPAYLIERGLITRQAVIDGDFEITSTPRRNRNVRVTSRASGDYLIKQPDDPLHPQAYTLRHEAMFYAFCQQEPRVAAVRALIPRAISTDLDQALVILELLRNSCTLWKYYEKRTANNFPIDTAAAVGAALGIVHQTFLRPGLLDDRRLAFLPRMTPWVLMVHRPGPDILSAIGQANYQILQILQTQPGLARQLDELRKLWQPQTVIHGDIKLDNMLALQPDLDIARGSPEVRIVDWELVQFGDPAWDLASAFHDFIVWWISTMSFEGSLDTIVQSARFPLPSLQPGIRALWGGYRDVREFAPADAQAMLMRAIRFSGARLIQSAYEMAVNLQSLPAASVLMLQVGANIFADPDNAREHLYGLAVHSIPK